MTLTLAGNRWLPMFSRSRESDMSTCVNRRHLMQGAAAVGAASALPSKRVFAQEPRAKLRLGIVPLISSGPVFIALAKGYFEKVNLDVEIKYFADGALAIP